MLITSSLLAHAGRDGCVSSVRPTSPPMLSDQPCFYSLFDGKDNADMLAQHAAVNTGVTISDQHSDREKAPSEDIIEEVKS